MPHGDNLCRKKTSTFFSYTIPFMLRSQEPFRQSHYVEVAQGDIFMEQKMGFGLVGNTAKNGGPIMSNF
jgi:hypothetical protein